MTEPIRGAVGFRGCAILGYQKQADADGRSNCRQSFRRTRADSFPVTGLRAGGDGEKKRDGFQLARDGEGFRGLSLSLSLARTFLRCWRGGARQRLISKKLPSRKQDAAFSHALTTPGISFRDERRGTVFLEPRPSGVDSPRTGRCWTHKHVRPLLHIRRSLRLSRSAPRIM